VLAIVFGLATAFLWATTLLASARASRLLGAWSTLAWVMLIGLVVTLPFVLATAPSVTLTGHDITLMAVAGVANSVGLLCNYAAVRRGKVALVGPIVSTEGAIAAVLAVIAGDPLSAAAAAVLAIIAVGVVLASIDRSAGDPELAPDPAAEARPIVPSRDTVMVVGLALGAAALFGLNLFVTSRIAGVLPLAWTVLPARLAGVVLVTIPLVLRGRLRLVRAAVPFVIVVGVCEVLGIATFALGARVSAPVTSVLASQFAGIAAVAAYLLFGERLRRVQVVGIVLIAIGVAVLAATQAS
jgi:drug/metabolite transporter (DMT)-like permease